MLICDEPFQGTAKATVEALLQHKQVLVLTAGQRFQVGRDLVILRDGSVQAQSSAGT